MSDEKKKKKKKKGRKTQPLPFRCQVIFIHHNGWIIRLGMVHHDDSLVYQKRQQQQQHLQPSSSTAEAIIQRKIEGIQMLIDPQHSNTTPEEQQTKTVITINPAVKKHWESQIKILHEAPRDANKLREILKAKQKEYEKTMDSEEIERLVPEIQTYKFVLFLVRREEKEKEEEGRHQ